MPNLNRAALVIALLLHACIVQTRDVPYGRLPDVGTPHGLHLHFDFSLRQLLMSSIFRDRTRVASGRHRQADRYTRVIFSQQIKHICAL